MLKHFRPLRPYTNGLNAAAIAHHSDPMLNHAKLLGERLEKEDLRRKYENAMLVLAFSVCVNVGVIIWFVIEIVQQR